jgi:hypothetical protein
MFTVVDVPAALSRRTSRRTLSPLSVAANISQTVPRSRSSKIPKAAHGAFEGAIHGREHAFLVHGENRIGCRLDEVGVPRLRSLQRRAGGAFIGHIAGNPQHADDILALANRRIRD